MRAVVCRELGPPQSVVIEERESPPLADDNVRVRVAAAGVNYVDGLFVQGRYQIVPDTPFTPGSELSGEVIEVGPEVHGWSVGDWVMSSVGLGAYVSEIDLRPEQLLAVPEGGTMPQAATLGQSYATAWFSLSRRIQASPREWIVVLGAAGGVGLAMLDVARALEMQTIAVASSAEKLELCITRGAHEVIDYTQVDLKTQVREITGGGADVVVDPVGGGHTEASLRALGEFGRLIIIGFASGDIASLPANQVLLRNRSVVGVDWGLWAMANPAENTQMMAELLDALGNGALNPVTPQNVPLEQAGQAMDDLLERNVTGKLCLIP
ncbi:MAG: NADPH:quinone oxidoreductase family protein [Microthrixaceae bacterium]